MYINVEELNQINTNEKKSSSQEQGLQIALFLQKMLKNKSLSEMFTHMDSKKYLPLQP
jgi:hypothetical protein